MRYTIATLASHSALQILKGAKDEGFQTLAFVAIDKVDFYKRFKFIDEIIILESYREIYKIQKKFKNRKIILIPHGSFVAYLGENYNDGLKMMHYGNKKVLEWEGNRRKQMEWLKGAGLLLPKVYERADLIDQLVMVKLYGAMGGSGYFLAKDKTDFEKKIHKFRKEKYIIQQYMVGTPVYLQYFYSSLSGNIELMGIDRRYETNVDGLSRIPKNYDSSIDIEPSYTVIGNFPIVIRESLLPEVYNMGKKVVIESKSLIPPHGLYGPFCLETILTPNQKFYCIEISCRIVAGTNLFIKGSPYTDLLYDEPMSTGRRIAREIKEAIKQDRLDEILD